MAFVNLAEHLSLNHQFQSIGYDSFIDGSSLDPTACVQQLRDPARISVVKKRLRQRDLDEEWIGEFLQEGGLQAIWDALEVCGRHDPPKTTAQLKCVECIKAVLTRPTAMDFMLRAEDKFVHRLVLAMGLPPSDDNAMVKIHLLFLLSVIARHSEKGFKATMSALDNYKQVKHLRHRFSLLAQELSSPFSPPQYQAVIMAFINYLIASCEDMDARISLRSALNGLHLHDFLGELREHDDLPECLSEQLRLYDERLTSDEEQMVMPGGVNINSHEDLFRALLEKFFNTPHSASLLSVLQKLLVIDRDSLTTEAVFSSLDKFLDSAIAMSDPSQVERVTQVGVERLRKALEAEESRKHATTTTDSNTSTPLEKAAPLTPTLEDVATPTSLPNGGPPSLSLPPPPVPSGGPPPPPPPPGGPPPPPGGPPPPPGGPPPPPGGPPPPPGGGPPPPPPFPSSQQSDTRDSKLYEVARVVLSIFQKARLFRPSRRMKKVNWEKIPDYQSSLKTALWHEGDVTLPFNVEDLQHNVEELFSLKGKGGSSGTDSPAENKKAHLPNSQKALNINLVLNDLKKPATSVVDMIRNGQAKSFTAVQAKVLLDQLPNDIDSGFLEQFTEESPKFGMPERFLYHLIRVPWYQFRIRILYYNKVFEDLIEDFTPCFVTLMDAFDELMRCSSLKEILFIILLIGNIINGGTKLGSAHGFKTSSLQRLSTTLANVGRPNTNFMHYLVTVCRRQCPHLLTFSSELRLLQPASRISYEELDTEIKHWREEITKCKDELEAAEDTPQDLADQVNVFIPNAEHVLQHLDDEMLKVKKKSEQAAEYFCDNRDNFIEMVFQEIWQFTVELKKAVKDSVENIPVPATWLNSLEEQPKKMGASDPRVAQEDTHMHVMKTKEETVVTSQSEPGHTHVYAAISAIVDEELEFFTPLEEVVGENDTSLPNVTEEVEEEEEFYSLKPYHGSIPSSANQGQANPKPDHSLKDYTYPHRKRSFPQITFSRSASVQTSSLSSGTLSPSYSQQSFSRSISMQPPQMYGKVFGSNRENVERILQRMADAIRMDLNFRQ